MRDACGAQPLDTAREDRQSAAALFRLAEEQLHPDADAEERPTGAGAGEERVRQAALLESAGRRSGVADPGDHGERCPLDLAGVFGDDGIGAGTLERRADAAQVPGAVVGDGDPHSEPLVEPTAAPSSEHASRNARPSALNAASATWWSSVPVAST